MAKILLSFPSVTSMIGRFSMSLVMIGSAILGLILGALLLAYPGYLGHRASTSKRGGLSGSVVMSEIAGSLLAR